MRQDAAAPWMAFEARQTISTVDCAFSWSARSGFARAIEVRDALGPEGGDFRVRALGLFPIASIRKSPELTRGELIRYLAELAWAPQAIMSNSDLRWTERNGSQLCVAASAGEVAAEVTLTLDARGRIAEVFCPDRPRAVKGRFEPTPWRGRFEDYSRREGVWTPSRGTVSWILDGRETPVWEGRILNWRARV